MRVRGAGGPSAVCPHQLRGPDPRGVGTRIGPRHRRWITSAGQGAFPVLDELGERPADLQPILLRTRETLSTSWCDQPPARLLYLTNRRMPDEVRAGRFREDLYDRLGAIVLEIPPLCDRGDDILLIFEHYHQLVASETGRDPLILGSDVQETLMTYAWPGNVRELGNAVYAMNCLVKSRRVTPSDLPFHNAGTMVQTPPVEQKRTLLRHMPSECLKDSEAAQIENVLTAHHGNLSRTAIALSISRPTFYRKLRIHKISVHESEA